jgi:hypothetical protein
MREETAEELRIRLFHNMAFEFKHLTQKMYDMLNLMILENPDLFVFDKFTIVERQLRILDCESSRMIDVGTKLGYFLQDMAERKKNAKATQDSPSQDSGSCEQ